MQVNGSKAGHNGGPLAMRNLLGAVEQTAEVQSDHGKQLDNLTPNAVQANTFRHVRNMRGQGSCDAAIAKHSSA